MNNFIKWQTIEYIEFKELKIPTRLLKEEQIKMILKNKEKMKIEK